MSLWECSGYICPIGNLFRGGRIGDWFGCVGVGEGIGGGGQREGGSQSFWEWAWGFGRLGLFHKLGSSVNLVHLIIIYCLKN
jgi:hypothetical protein